LVCSYRLSEAEVIGFQKPELPAFKSRSYRLSKLELPAFRTRSYRLSEPGVTGF